MNRSHREPTLDEILSDSIVAALMEADGVDPQDLAATLRLTGRKLVRRGCAILARFLSEPRALKMALDGSGVAATRRWEGLDH
jgi:hypothetical protein